VARVFRPSRAEPKSIFWQNIAVNVEVAWAAPSEVLIVTLRQSGAILSLSGITRPVFLFGNISEKAG
jgi:hypothetical protein